MGVNFLDMASLLLFIFIGTLFGSVQGVPLNASCFKTHVHLAT
jgi:hypothetical protein